MKLFEKYELNDVVVHDAGLAKYMNLSPIVIPHTGGRWANKPFGKAKANLVERLINNMMRTENYTGKKSKSYRVVRSAFEIIEKRTQKNPVQVLVDALEKAAPREEVTRLRFGGISVPRAVDAAPALLHLKDRIRNIGTAAHIDHGKCLSGDARTWVNGQWIRADELWSRFAHRPPVPNAIGADVRDVLSDSLWTRSLDVKTGTSAFAQITHVWRLRSTEPLIEVEARDGRRIRTTAEHPFVVASGVGLDYKEARELREGDALAVPRRLPSHAEREEDWAGLERGILNRLD